MDIDIHIPIYAYHASGNYKNEIIGIGALIRKDDLIAGVGRYSNSVGVMSNYALIGSQPFRIGPVKIGAVVGLVNGYPHYGNRYGPLGGVFATHKGWHVMYAPKVPNQTPHTLSLSYSLSLN